MHRLLGVRLHGEKRRLRVTRVSESLAVIVEMPIGAIEDDAAKRLLKGHPCPGGVWGDGERDGAPPWVLSL